MKKSMWLIYLVSFMGVAGFTAAMPIMPYFVKAMGGTTLDNGLVLGLTALVAVFSGPIIGYYGDRIGRRPVLIASMFGFVAWYACFFFARNMTVVYIGAFIGGIFASGALAVATAYATDLAGPDKVGGLIANMQASQMVGALLARVAEGSPVYAVAAAPGFFRALGFVLSPDAPCSIARCTSARVSRAPSASSSTITSDTSRKRT